MVEIKDDSGRDNLSRKIHKVGTPKMGKTISGILSEEGGDFPAPWGIGEVF